MSDFSWGDWASGHSSGFLAGYDAAQNDFRRSSQQPSHAEQLQSITETLDTEIKKFLSIVDTIPVRNSELRALAKKAIFYQVCAGLIARGEMSIAFEIMNPICKRHQMPCTKADITAALKSEKPLYLEEGVLTRTACGTFWTTLMKYLPSSSNGTGEGYPLELFDLFAQAERLYGELVGDASIPLHLDERFASHHQRYSLLTPNLKRLKDSIRQSDSTDPRFRFTFVYRDLITASFPEPGQWWDCDTLSEMDEEELLAAVYKRDPQLAIQMWRLLLDTVGEKLGDKDVARRLLGIEIAGTCNRVNAWHCDSHFDPILDELAKDDGFARQLYLSAALPIDLLALLVVCCARERVPLMEHLRDLITQNPCFEELYRNGMPKWMQSLPQDSEIRRRRGVKPATVSPSADMSQMDDTTEYRYCHVAIEGVRQIYPYLCEDATIVPGDYVRVPFGRENTERVAIVKRVGLYTVFDAPYPPDKTKRILGRGEQP